MKHNLPDQDRVFGGKNADSPIAHYPNWAFMCTDCPPQNSYFELPQDLPEIEEAYQEGTLTFQRPCGCKNGNIHPQTKRLWEIM